MALILFDVDGTLLAGGDPTHARAFHAVFRERFGVDADLRGLELAGRTDRRILLAALERRGVRPADAQVRDALAHMEEFVEREMPASIEDRVLPGVRDLLGALAGHRVGLVTGNPPRIARAKLRAAGLWDAFEPGLGGFGDLSVERADLVLAALERARRPAREAVVVGDTRHDIEAARAHGARSVGVATGRTTADDLRGAGAGLVLGTLEERDAFLAFVEAP